MLPPPSQFIWCEFLISKQVGAENKGRAFLCAALGSVLSQPLTHQSPPCASLGFPGQECERASSLPPQGGFFFCMRFNWLSWTVCQRSGQRSAYVARKCQIIPSNVCLCVFGGTELRDWKNDFSNRQFRILRLLIEKDLTKTIWVFSLKFEVFKVSSDLWRSLARSQDSPAPPTPWRSTVGSPSSRGVCQKKKTGRWMIETKKGAETLVAC